MSVKWNYIRFGNLFDYENKSKIKAGDGLESGSYPFYTSSVELTKFIDQFQFDKTSLIFGTGGNASIHYCDKPFSVSTDCLVAFAKDETKVYPKYVFYYLSGNINLLEEGFKGAGLKHISKGYINDIQIPLPPLATQKRIAEILDTADALRRKDQELLKKYDELAQAIFIDMFGDPTKNEKGWDVKTIGSITKVGSGSTPSRQIPSYFKGNIPWVKTTEVNGKIINSTEELISDEALENSSCKIYPENSVIIAMYGQGKTRGQVALLGIEAATNQACGVILPCSSLNPKFLFNYLKFSYNNLRNLGRGGNQENLNKGMIEDYLLMIPPIVLQLEFNQRLDILLKQETILNVFKSESLFNSLLQKAFKGELVS